MTTRAQVVQAARAWIGTPFHHQARLCGVGVDCDGLVIGVSRELGLVAPDFDVPAYSRTPDGTSLMAHCCAHMTRIYTPMRAGDVVVLDFASYPHHMGIVCDYRHGGLSMIHASSTRGRVEETRLMYHARMRFVAAFALPGVDE